MKISRLIGFIGIASVMTNQAQAQAWQNDVQFNFVHSEEWLTTGRELPYVFDDEVYGLGEEKYREVSPHEWLWLGDDEIKFEDRSTVELRSDWKTVDRNHFKFIPSSCAAIDKWQERQDGLKLIEKQFEAKQVEMVKPATSYWFWKK